MTRLETSFHALLVSDYWYFKSKSVPQSRTAQMLFRRDANGRNIVKRMLATNENWQTGFVECCLNHGSEDWKRSWEARMLEPQWYSLFTDEEREIAASRLRALGFQPTIPMPA